MIIIIKWIIILENVNMNKFEAERIIEFTPPDGKFQLMSYRLNTQLKPLIWVEVNINQLAPTKIEYRVKAKSNYKNKSVAHNVEISIPVPNDLKNPVFKKKIVGTDLIGFLHMFLQLFRKRKPDHLAPHFMLYPILHICDSDPVLLESWRSGILYPFRLL